MIREKNIEKIIWRTTVWNKKALKNVPRVCMLKSGRENAPRCANAHTDVKIS